MKKVNLNKGVTLIALIITIIVLLILAGIVLAMVVGDNGILAKAQTAKSKTNSSQDTELNNLSDYGEKIFNLGRSGTANLKDCTITISEKGLISVSGVENMRGFIISKNDEFLDITTNNQYTLRTPAGEKESVYVIAVDKDLHLYKSNTAEYTASIVYLYCEGETNNELTGGWSVSRQSNSAVDMDSYDYMDLDSYNDSYCYVNIYSNKKIDLSNYTYLKMEVTCVRYVNVNTNVFGLKNSEYTPYTELDYQTSYETTLNQKKVSTFNISNYRNNPYRIAFRVVYNHIKVHKIWLE